MHSPRFSLIAFIFFISLAFSISISVPALNINDEWITVNQLYQLGSGHQLVFNEGKYGSFLSGDDTPYFLERHNILGYSLAVPIASFPTLFFFKALQSAFRFFVIITVSFSLILCGLIVLHYYPQHSIIRRIKWPWILLLSGFFLLLVNFLYFTPFYASDPYPIEVAAVVFTEHILFALLAVILYLTCRAAFTDEWYSLFGCLALISCSSYLYWATNAKDHLLTTVVFSFIAYFFIQYLREDSWKNAFCSFLSAGILVWVRPELGITTCGCLFFYYVTDFFLHRKKEIGIALKQMLVPIAAIMIGSVPFFLNNWFITGNPILPIFIAYAEDLTGSEIPILTENPIVQTSSPGSSIPLPSPVSGDSINPVSVLLSYFSPHWDTLIHDIVLLFFTPESGMMGIIGMTPLFLVGMAIIPLIWFWKRDILTKNDTRIWGLIIILIIAVLIAYIRDFSGMVVSEGIGPDMRYLTPIYIPAGILGLYGIFFSLNTFDLKKFSIYSIILCSIFSPLFILLLLIIQPLGGGFIEYTYTLSLCGTITAGLVLLYLLSSIVRKKILPGVTFSISLLCAFPLSWQLMMVFLFSITKFNGYPFWLPIVEHIYSLFIIPVG